MINYSENESANFGLKIYRARVEQLHFSELLVEVANELPDMVFLRLPFNEALKLQAAQQDTLPLLWADNVLEFRKPLRKDTISDDLGSGTFCRVAGPEDSELLLSIVNDCYFDYANHYFANQYLNHDRVLSGMAQWACTFIEPASGQKSRVLLIYRAEQPIGFLILEARGRTGSTVLGGVSKSISAGLRHKALVDATRAGDLILLDWQCSEFVAQTRIDNHYIQKLLVKNMHTRPFRTWATLHLNLFFDRLSQQTGEKISSADYAAELKQTLGENLKLIRFKSLQLADKAGHGELYTYPLQADGLKEYAWLVKENGRPLAGGRLVLS